MTREERRKAILSGVAVAAVNPLVPAAVRVAIAALAEEVHELRGDIDALIQARRESGH